MKATLRVSLCVFWLALGGIGINGCACPDEEGVLPGDLIDAGVQDAHGRFDPDSDKPDGDVGPSWDQYCEEAIEQVGGMPESGNVSCDTDGDACTIEVCNTTTFTCEFVTTNTCTDKTCQTGSCDKQTGECVYTNVEHGLSCNSKCYESGFVCDASVGDGEPAQCVEGELSDEDVDGDGFLDLLPTEATVIDCSDASLEELLTAKGATFEERQCAIGVGCATETGECTRIVYAGEGASCDLDNNICSVDRCFAASDEHGDEVYKCSETDDEFDCSDKNSACFTWSCVDKIGCKSTFNEGFSCNDNNNCSEDDTCVITNGQQGCAGTPIDFDDNNPCTDDSCFDGQGVYTPLVGLVCDDGKLCTNTQCNADGECAVVSTDKCDDGDVCTKDICDPLSGCVHIPESNVPCDDDSSCTEGDECQQGTCKGTPIECEDQDPCNGTMICDNEEGCVPHLPAPICNDNNPCTDNLCNPDFKTTQEILSVENGKLTDACGFPNNTLPCDDNSACTDADTCQQGACVGIDKQCNDGNICTGLYVCDDAEGCVEIIPPQPEEGACDDSNPCTTDFCDPLSGCVNIPNNEPCSDGDACTTDDACKFGACVGGQPPVCDDNNVCNGFESCNSEVGCVAGTPLACNDNNACNGEETCNTQTGCVDGVPLQCNNGDKCDGEEICNPALGCVAGTPLACNDNNICNGIETCHALLGCQPGNALTCKDENVCNGDETCHPALGCQPGEDLECDDNDKCSGTESCHPTLGCQAGTPLICDDNNVCNGVFSCTPVLGCIQVAGSLTCNDNNPCTNDSCDPTEGCVAFNNSLPCDDGDKCSIGDTCVEGVCTPVSGNKVCDDNNICTTDTCEPATGACLHPTAEGAACDDGNFCTLVDYCTTVGDTGGCVGSGDKICPSDNDPCTIDTCNPFSPNCEYPELTCDDENACTLDYCGVGPGGGGCFYINVDNGTKCGENDVGTCQAGECVEPGG